MKAYLHELLKRKDLIIYLVGSGLKAQHKNSFLGYLWWLLDPLLGIAIYYFVVAIIFKSARGPNYGAYLVVGMIVWRWLASTVSASAHSILSQSGLITQVYLPKSIFPLGVSLTQLINFGFGLIVIAIFLAFFKISPGLHVLWLPFIVLMQGLFITMISFPIAYFCVFVRDVDNIVNHLMRLWFFGSPVVWYEEMIPARGRWLLEINPMTHFLASYRKVFIFNTMPDYGMLLLIGMMSLFFILMMIFFYSQNEHKIIKAL